MRKNKSLSVIVFIVLLLGSIPMILPFIWMVSTSLKSLSSTMIFPPEFFPKSPRWQNYTELFSLVPIKDWFLNSIFLSVVNSVGIIISSLIVAFGFVVLNFKFKDVLFIILLSTMMIPFEAIMIPQYILFNFFGWVNTLYPLWVPSFFGSAYMIFFARQFFKTLSKDYVDAAKIDGANYWQIFYKIFIPLSYPVIVTIGLLTFINTWNYFLGPLIYLNTPSKMTIVSGLSFLSGQAFGYWNYIMAGSTLAILPIIVLFLITQKWIISGIALQGELK